MDNAHQSKVFVHGVVIMECAAGKTLQGMDVTGRLVELADTNVVRLAVRD